MRGANNTCLAACATKYHDSKSQAVIDCAKKNGCTPNATSSFTDSNAFSADTVNSISIVPDELKQTPAECIKKHCKKQGTACVFDKVRI